MRWIGISGTWRLTSKEVEGDVRHEVRSILERGDGIITGGALGVDSFAASEVVQQGFAGTRVTICLPVTFDLYVAHYRKRADEGVITDEQAENLALLLSTIKEANESAVIEGTRFTVCDKESYYARDGTIVDMCDELYAFQVNGSAGTQDTIEKAKARGKEVRLFTYII